MKTTEALTALVDECQQYRGFSGDAGLLIDAHVAIDAVESMYEALEAITLRLELAASELPGTFPGKAMVSDLRSALDKAVGR